MKNNDLPGNEKGITRPVLILLIIIGLLVAGGIGYTMGANAAQSDLEAKVDERVQDLQQELDEAKTVINNELDESQESIEEGQQTLESLQAENAELKTTIQQQTQKIAELEEQLEEANATPPAQ